MYLSQEVWDVDPKRARIERNPPWSFAAGSSPTWAPYSPPGPSYGGWLPIFLVHNRVEMKFVAIFEGGDSG